MEECEDETNSSEYGKCSGYSAPPISRPYHEAHEGTKFRCKLKTRSGRAGCHEKDTLTSVPVRKLRGAACTTKISQSPNSAQYLSGIGYSDTKRAEFSSHIKYERSDVSTAGKCNYKKGLDSGIFSDKACVPSCGKMQEQYAGDWLKNGKESSISYPDKSTRVKEFHGGYMTDIQVREGVRRKENCSSDKLKVPVNGQTCKSKEYMRKRSSEKVKAPFNLKICKSIEELGNHSSKRVKVPVNVQTRKSKEDIENGSFEQVKAPVKEQIRKSIEDTGNCSSKNMKSPVNGLTCKSKEDMGNHSSDKVKAPINGQTHKSEENMDDMSSRKASSEDGDWLFMINTKSKANISAQERKQEEENFSRRKQNRGDKKSRSMQASERVMMDDSIEDENPEKAGRNENVIDYSEDHQTTSTGSNKCHEDSQSAAKPGKDRSKTMKRPVEKCEALPDVSVEDANEIILTEMNEKVQTLLKEDPSEMCKKLSKKKTMLKNIIKASCNDHELLILVIDLLEKALSSHVANHEDYALIITLKDTSFFEEAIVPFLCTLKIEEYLHWHQHLPVLKNIIRLALIFFSRTPTSMCLIFGLLDILHRIAEDLRLIDNPDKTLQEIKEGLVELHAMKENQGSKMLKKSMTHRVSHAFAHENEQPPDNFREIEMYPQFQEIKAVKPAFCRMNKETGGYNDLEHYLDVQYRLLREDFICPLREGIREYKQNIHMKKKKLQDLRLYYDVTIQQLAPGRDGIYHQIEFNVSHLRHVEWAQSKRLLYGSFLCLSSDDFETMLFATVANRNPQKLRLGIVSVSFQTNLKDVMKRSHETFVMAESVAFFEAYKHVLFGLQNIIRLPFQKHLVNCEKDVDPPIYLSRTDSAVYDLQPLLDRKMTISKYQPTRQQVLSSKAHRNVDVLSLSEWPSADDMGLDRSQYKAIQTALTRRFSITQGPPGTGKTYIGLQIVRVLLHNRHFWDEDSNALLDNVKSPVLIVCYTNHALDQFLEGIFKFYIGDIVRVGGRSSSEVSERHHLDKFRERFKRKRLIPREIEDACIHERELLNLRMERLHAKAKALEQAKERILLTEEDLRPYMQTLYESLIFGFQEIIWSNICMVEYFAQNGLRTWVIQEWLGCGYLTPRNNATIEVDRVMTYDGAKAFFELNDEITDEIINTCAVKQMNKITRGEIANEKRKTGDKGDQNGLWQIYHTEIRKRKEDLKRQQHARSVMEQEQVDKVVNVWALAYEDRWCLYRYWRQLYLNALEEDFFRQAELCEEVMKTYKEAKMKEDGFILQHADIIGMTTTCAARYQRVLQEIGPRIIIVEEAAEILESHVLTTLSEHCQHLILIGDHEQLRPNPATYTLAKDYKLDISLFERMVNNGIQCDCLEEQHRMRPEISMLLRHIYRNLRDHESVEEYEHIRGVGTNIFFIDHSKEELADTDQKSHLNKHEARYVVALCKYLLRQGYSPNQITVLTTYSGQLFCLRNMMSKPDLNGVKVTVVDNYQGEENDIILLSLVRSNREGRIGFLKISNRICVALSRAKKGLYAIGNFGFLARHSELWRNIIKTLEKEKRLGEALTLFCQNHPNDGFEAADARDFEIFSPEGGCKKKCKTQLNCGHFCERRCHPDDRSHEKYQCQEPCGRLCERGHSCKKPCYQNCKHCTCMVDVAKTMTACGHVQTIPCYLNPSDFRCKFPVSRTLLICGHTVTIKCCEDVTLVKCPMPCEQRLSCGHVCRRSCGEMHTTSCIEVLEEILECGHKVHIQCCKSKSKVICTEKCTLPLKCGHTCHKMCGEKHDHDQYCKELVTRNIPSCEHTVQAFCSLPESKLRCDTMIEVKLNCGHTSKAMCGQESSLKCNIRIKKNCEYGHISHVPCHRADNFKCQSKCDTRLLCGHHCSGDCTACFNGRLHKRCSVSNCETLICGHACAVLCSYYPPCQKKCDQKCPHKICKKSCLDVCESCIEPCTWSCPHFQCTKICSDICDRPPCNEPCLKRLKCGHSCIGICGEPCPTLCRICNKDKVTERRFGTETNPKATFVQLSDCGHVVEVTAMDRWMQSQMQQGDLSEIRFPLCPVCRTPIRNSVRYQRELKKNRRAIRVVKSKLRNSDKKEKFEMDNVISKIKTLESLFNLNSKEGLEKQISEAFMKSVDTFKTWISRQKDIVTPQQQLDIRDEITRMQLMLKLIIVRAENVKGDAHLSWNLHKAISSARTVLLSGERLERNRKGVRSCVETLARLSTSSAFDEALLTYNVITEVKKEWSMVTWMTCKTGHVFRKVERINGSCPWC